VFPSVSRKAREMYSVSDSVRTYVRGYVRVYVRIYVLVLERSE